MYRKEVPIRESKMETITIDEFRINRSRKYGDANMIQKIIRWFENKFKGWKWMR